MTRDMEGWNGGKNEEMYLSMLKKSGSAMADPAETLEELRMLRRQKRAYFIFKVCEIVVFICLTCAFVYSFKSLWDLRTELGNLRDEIMAEVSRQENFDDALVGDDPDPTVPMELLDEGDSYRSGGVLKRKREIASSNENISEQSLSSEERKTTPSTDSEEGSSEALLYPPTWTTKKPCRNGKRSKKFYRHSVSAEKFFTKIESTTMTPIQVRQSRTQLTQVPGGEKHKSAVSRKPLLQIYGSKESITREEALRRPGSAFNLIPENMGEWANRLRSENASHHHSSTQKRQPDTISYNMIMVHYAADTSHYKRERDSHYFGNGRMQMKTSIYKDWTPTHWTQGIAIPKYFTLNQGKVSVSVTGIYLIYAQVQYSNVQEVNGYSIVCNKQTVVQCISTSVHPDKNEVKSNTCGISTTILLHSNDRIYLQDLHHGRHVVLTPEKSYFGLILLSPFKDVE